MSGPDFARFYAAQYSAYSADISLWLHLAAETGDPVLDLGCGTGRVTVALARAGHTVTGLDSDPDMLAGARRSLSPELGDRVSLRHADVRSFVLEERFRLAVCACNTFATLDDQGASSATSCICRQLAAGGLLALDLPNARESLGFTGSDTGPIAAFLEPQSGNPVQVSARETTVRRHAAVDVTWFYDELYPDGSVRRTAVPMRYHLRDAQMMHRLLRDAGFATVRTYGSYALGRLRPTSSRMIVLARLRTRA